MNLEFEFWILEEILTSRPLKYLGFYHKPLIICYNQFVKLTNRNSLLHSKSDGLSPIKITTQKTTKYEVKLNLSKKKRPSIHHATTRLFACCIQKRKCYRIRNSHVHLSVTSYHLDSFFLFRINIKGKTYVNPQPMHACMYAYPPIE